MSVALTKLSGYRGSSLGTYSGKSRFLVNTAISASGTQHVDVDVSDFDLATIYVEMTGAATTDLSVLVVPVEEADDAVGLAGLPVTAGTAVLSSGKVAQVIQVNTTGLQGIEIQVTNKNAGAQTIQKVDVFAGVTGTDF